MLDSSDADIQNGMDFTLLQMKAETLASIERALARLEAGQYGDCAECGNAIAERRLRAIPFAVRCHECEGEREQSHRGRMAPPMDFGTTLVGGYINS